MASYNETNVRSKPMGRRKAAESGLRTPSACTMPPFRPTVWAAVEQTNGAHRCARALFLGATEQMANAAAACPSRQ
ncbi:hypothetical protein M514_04112 [Trichuris suis]|uniref:Uncharacterized protein n=1 Tax=Trichuris suis TaxID=68888 RepID=A0A085NG11_9BILA|nr:hypothetical protein M513_04112 [Trichuris suis]KFD68407.1 hypothetical protein M514_04112 [Trichuris suis]